MPGCFMKHPGIFYNSNTYFPLTHPYLKHRYPVVTVIDIRADVTMTG